MSKNKILEIKDVSYRYKDAKKDEYVLKNINYNFELGKVYAIKGKSGSGKTTLLSLIRLILALFFKVIICFRI